MASPCCLSSVVEGLTSFSFPGDHRRCYRTQTRRDLQQVPSQLPHGSGNYIIETQWSIILWEPCENILEISDWIQVRAIRTSTCFALFLFSCQNELLNPFFPPESCEIIKHSVCNLHNYIPRDHIPLHHWSCLQTLKAWQQASLPLQPLPSSSQEWSNHTSSRRTCLCKLLGCFCVPLQIWTLTCKVVLMCSI